MDANKAGRGTRSSKEDGTRCDANASLNALDDGIEIRRFGVLEAAVHGAFRLDRDPTETLGNDGRECGPVGAHDVANFLQMSSVIIEVLSDVSGESVLQPRERDVDRVVFGHDGVDVLGRSDEVAHAPALESERLREAAHDGNVRGQDGLLHGRVETILRPDEVAVALVEDDEAIEGRGKRQQLLHYCFGGDKATGVAWVANEDGVQFVRLYRLLDVFEAD